MKSNDKLLITNSKLIIDIRGNGGGADRCYEAIIPYLYTNPIRTMWVDFRSTKLNNSRYDELSTHDGFSEKDKQELRDMKKKLDSSLGGYVNINDGGRVFSIDTLPKVYENPKQVAILIDKGNASTAEQFILLAKQSKKVKLFGTKTFGALDFSNINQAVTPSGIFKLYYTTSRSYRIPAIAQFLFTTG